MDTKLEHTLRLRHLEQLRQLPVNQSPPPVKRLPGNQLHVTPAWINQATTDTLSIIQEAVISGARGNKQNVTWNVALLAFMESAAVYLRDVNLLAQAVTAIKSGLDGHAMDLLRSADAPIQAVANMWDLDYMTVCDLVDDHAEGHWWWDGPYAGVFVSRSATQPWVGLAFKGTVTTSVAELLVDVAYQPVASTVEALPNVHVSAGVYGTLFEPFKSLNGQAPYNYIIEQMQTLFAPTNKAYNLHVTGHSLGASYATLFHTALLSVQAGSGTFTKPSGSDPAQRQSDAAASAPAPLAALITLRDLWTFGSPRLGLADFAQLQHDLMATHDGASWRLVDAKDPVALVPPDPLHLGKAGDAFVHVDAGVRMSSDAPPVPIPSELEGVEKTGVSALLHFPNHFITSYFSAVHATAMKASQAVAEAS